MIESIKAMCTKCYKMPVTCRCCSSHNAMLCHGCYRRTHFVEVCIQGCALCRREGLPVIYHGGAA